MLLKSQNIIQHSFSFVFFLPEKIKCYEQKSSVLFTGEKYIQWKTRKSIYGWEPLLSASNPARLLTRTSPGQSQK